MNEASGKFVLRLPRELHQSLRSRAGRMGTSLNATCIEILERGLTESPLVSKSVNQFFDRRFREQLIGIVLFGSTARGTRHDNSDIDLLVVVDESIPLTRDLYRDLDSPDDSIEIHFAHLPKKVDDAGSLWLECALEGKIVMDKSNRIRDTLSKLRSHILSGRIVRKETHGQGYWVRV